MSCLRRIFRSGGGSFTPSPTPAPSPTPTPTPTPGVTGINDFVIAVFNQPSSTRAAIASQAVGPDTFGNISASSDVFGDWKTIGVSHILGCDNTLDPQVWDQQVIAAGLRPMRNPSINQNFNGANGTDRHYDDSPAAIAAALTWDVAHLDAFQLEDEPDLANVGQGLINYVQAQITALGSFKDSIPIYQNMVGSNIAHEIYHGAQDGNGVLAYQGIVNLPDISIFQGDYYPAADKNEFYYYDHPAFGYLETYSGLVVDQYSNGWTDFNGAPYTRHTEALSVGKQAGVHISLGRIPYFKDGVTSIKTPVDCYIWEAWDAIINGASGITYFPQALDASGGWHGYYNYLESDDQTALKAAVTQFHTNVKTLRTQTQGDFIWDGTTRRRRGTYYRTARAAAGSNPGAGLVPYPFKAREIVLGGETIRIISNNTRSSQTFNDTGKSAWGLNGVTFTSGQVKVFKASTGTTPLLTQG